MIILEIMSGSAVLQDSSGLELLTSKLLVPLLYKLFSFFKDFLESSLKSFEEDGVLSVMGLLERRQKNAKHREKRSVSEIRDVGF